MNVTRIWQACAGFGGVRLLLVLATGVLLGACGGGGGGNGGGDDPVGASFQNNPNGLGANEGIVVRFGTSVNPGSLELSGELANYAEAEDQFQWNEPDNSVVVIEPAADDYWQPIGESGTFTATANPISGGTRAASEEFRIILRFDAGGGFTALEPVVVGQSALSDGPDDSAVFENPKGNPAYLPISLTENRLYFPDTSLIRGLNGIPESNVAQGADFFSIQEAAFNTLGSVTASEETGMLLVANTGGDQILGFNPAPSGNSSVEATVIAGNGSGVCTPDTLNAPESVFLSENGWLFVADTGSNRVLIWENNPDGTGPPTYVLGQAGFSECDANRGGAATRATLSSPVGVWADSNRIVVTDRGNDRALIWELPVANGDPADVVLGQGNTTLSSIDVPTAGVTSNGEQLFISDNVDGVGKGVLVWNTFPTGDNQPAFGLLGPGDDAGRENFSAGGLLLVEDRLILGQPENGRYLIFQSQ